MVRKITQTDVDRAKRTHFQKEDLPTLNRFHAMSYLFYKQKGESRIAKGFLTSPEFKIEADKSWQKRWECQRKKAVSKRLKI